MMAKLLVAATWGERQFYHTELRVPRLVSFARVCYFCYTFPLGKNGIRKNVFLIKVILKIWS